MLTSNSKINILASKNMKEVDFLKWFETGMTYTGFGEYFEGDIPLNISLLSLIDLKGVIKKNQHQPLQ